MSAPEPVLTLTAEQLTVLALAAGYPGYPGVGEPGPGLDAAAWVAVADSLHARGLFEDGNLVPDGLVGIPLVAEACLSLAISAPAHEPRREAFWRHEGIVVRQSSVAGLHGFGACVLDEVAVGLRAALGPDAPLEAAVEVRHVVEPGRIEGETLALTLAADGTVRLDGDGQPAGPLEPAAACDRLAVLLEAV